ncbi:chloride channel, variant 2 [Chamberlinius hualienensis]
MWCWTSVTFLLIFLSIRLSVVTTTSSVVFRNGIYDGIVVAIAPNVPETSKDKLLESIRQSFIDASANLFTATDRMARFGHIRILVPKTWSSGDIRGFQNELATHETWNDADVRIGDANPQYGDQPYTLQPGLCGEPASYIHLTPKFFTETNDTLRKYGPTGKVLLHEWAHYRYGVFDEYGYPGDATYPAVYSDGAEMHPTACSNAQLQGQISESCKEYGTTDPRCKFEPKIDQRGVNSSIMSMHFLPEVNQFCDHNSHNKFAPTKQNALCNRRSVWEVMKSHPDFNQTYIGAVNFGHPTFSVVRPSSSRYVLLLDCSSNMNNFVNKNSSTMQRITFVRSAAVRFIEDSLPNGSLLSLIAFGDRAQVLKPLSEMSPSSRKGFTNAIPWVTCGGAYRNIVSALREAIKQLNTPSSNRTDGTIITVTNGLSDNAQGYEDVKAELVRRNIRAVNIIYPPMPEVTPLPSLADVTAGRNYMIAEIGAGQKGNSSTLAQLLSAFDDAVVTQSGNPTEDRITMYERVHPIRDGDISGSFVVDSSIGKNMRVVISYYQRENVVSLLLRSPKRAFGIDDYDDDNKKRILTFNIKDEEIMTGVWTYEITVNRHDDQPITVTASAQPKQGQQPITLSVRTNVGSKAVDARKTPIVIYAELFKGSRPVINAKVRAIIERPKINNTHSFTEIELLDNGSGAPDANKHDGVYSRYFTQFVDPVGAFGFYSITIYADDNDGRSRVVGEDLRYIGNSGVRPQDPRTSFCCGKEGPQMLTESAGPFQRVSSAPAFLITVLPSSDVDVFPPSTVHDLKVDSVDPVTGYITLSWTAPGKDYDSGTVSSYELRYYNNYQSLINNFEWTGLITVPVTIEPAGILQSITFFPPDGRNRFYYFAIRAIDGAQKGEVSNVVMSFVPPEPTTTTPPTFPTDSTGSMVVPTQPSIARPLLTAELIGIIVGCTLAFLLAVAIIVALICANRRRRKLQEKKMTHHTVSQVHGPDVVRPPSIALLPPNGKDSYINTSGLSTPTKSEEFIKNENSNGSVYYTQASSLINPRQFVPASEFLQHHDKQLNNSYTNNGGNQSNNYYYEDETGQVTRSPYSGHYAPMDVVVDRTSISSKPSSYGSQQTAEVTSNSGYGLVVHQRDIAGYVNSSYEDGSENSAETARLRPDTGLAYGPMVTAPRRVLSESQV